MAGRMDDTEKLDTRYTRVRHDSWDSDTEDADHYLPFDNGRFRYPLDSYAHRERHGIPSFAITRPGGYAFLKWLETRERRNLVWDAKNGRNLDGVVTVNLIAYCINYREKCYRDDDFAVGGDGLGLALVAAEEVLTQESYPSLEEFKAWNSEISPTWHNDHPPCACGRHENPYDRDNDELWGIGKRFGRDKICGVCYQIQTKLKQPWYLSPSSSTTHPPKLCATCSHIDFNFMFNTICEPFPLSSLQHILGSKDDCNFCCLLGDSLEKHYGETMHVAVDGHPTTVCIIGSDLDGDAGFISLHIRFQTISQAVPPIYSDHPDDSNNSDRRVCSFRIYRASTEQNPAGARLVDDTVDFEVIKEWIKGCHRSGKIEENLDHSMKNVTLEADNAAPDFNLRVIDVHDCNVQELPLGARYFTLSYVWGGPQLFRSTIANRHIIEHPKGLKIDTLPLTIRDAIKLVRNIGERYLWVDSLCIIQDDPITSVAHINAMDRIYEGAIATIIATTGDSADSGLLGMRKVKERFQHRQKVRDLTLVSGIMPKRLKEKPFENPSIWSTRAWTFQEYQLSRYCIEFGLDGVRLHYSSGTSMESKYAESYDSGIRSEQFLQSTWTTPANPRALLYQKLEGETNFSGYNSLVKEYSKREMSLTTDVLNAFAGIITRLRPLFRSEFIFGLPAAEIDTALLWLSTGSLKRRRHPITGIEIFPSWSWCGWVGEVDYNLRYGHIDNLNILSWIDPVSKQKIESDELRGRSATKSDLHEVSPYGFRASGHFEEKDPKRFYEHSIRPGDERLHFHSVAPTRVVELPISTSRSPSKSHRREFRSPANFMEKEPDNLYEHSIKPEYERLPIHLVAYGSQNIEFEAMVAEFPISKWRVPCDSPDKSYSEFGLFTFDGFLAGSFVTADGVIPKNKFMIQEVIALSRIERERGQNLPSLVVSRPKGFRSRGYYGPSYNHLKLPLKPYTSDVADSNISRLTTHLLPSLDELITSRYKDWILCERRGANFVAPKCPFDIDVFDMDAPCLFYNIMVIEWKQGVAYRVGVGVCHVDAFHRGNPVRKTIVLG